MLLCHNRPIAATPFAPNGGDRVAMANLHVLDIPPVVICSHEIREFLSLGDDLENNPDWEVANYGTSSIVYRKKCKSPLNYKVDLCLFALSTVTPSWYEVFHQAYAGLEKVSKGIYNAIHYEKDRLVPDLKDIFNAFNLCPLPMIKVVIMGQGPYPWLVEGLPVANGLAFSTDKGQLPEASLKTIYKELERCYNTTDTPFVPPKHGDLRSWARQGVLLLNATLTGVGRKHGDPPKNGSKKEPHEGRWNPLLSCAIKAITRQNKNVVFMAWGQDSQRALSKLGIIGKHTILMSAHPSPLASGAKNKFLGCGHFLEANEILAKDGKEPINWHSVMKI